MKLFKLFLPMLTIAAMATGCTKEYYTLEYYTDSSSGVNIYTHQYTITPAQWNRNQGPNNPGADNYLYASFNNADITADVMENGAVQAFVYNVYDVQNNLGAWNTLPFVFPLEVYVTNDEGGTDMVVIPENLRFEWEEGKVTFIIQDLDGVDPENMVSSIAVKVCVTK